MTPDGVDHPGGAAGVSRGRETIRGRRDAPRGWIQTPRRRSAGLRRPRNHREGRRRGVRVVPNHREGALSASALVSATGSLCGPAPGAPNPADGPASGSPAWLQPPGGRSSAARDGFERPLGAPAGRWEGRNHRQRALSALAMVSTVEPARERGLRGHPFVAGPRRRAARSVPYRSSKPSIPSWRRLNGGTPDGTHRDLCSSRPFRMMVIRDASGRGAEHRDPLRSMGRTTF